MNDINEKILTPVLDGWEQVLGGKPKRNAEGKVTNRSTAYALFKRLPLKCRVKIGKREFLHIPNTREWLNDGGDLAA
jgi:hypothetical protein